VIVICHEYDGANSALGPIWMWFLLEITFGRPIVQLSFAEFEKRMSIVQPERLDFVEHTIDHILIRTS
jgi:hypothetical protein